jgi:hypothetical protein
LAARNTEEKFVWVMGRRGGKKRGQTMDYRCRYCCVDFSGADQEGGGDCNTFTLASSVLEDLGVGGNGEDA